MESAPASEVYRLRDVIEEQFAFGCELAQLGEQFGYSSSSVLRRFRNHWGVTPRQYVENRRYQAAKKLLVETDTSVTEICYQVGYQSVPSFVRRFKEVHGCTPTEYRFRQRRFWIGWTKPQARYIPGCVVSGLGGFCNLR